MPCGDNKLEKKTPLKRRLSVLVGVQCDMWA
jgi:hypothetical protein